MKELNFETGIVAYSLGGKVEVAFNPTDNNFVERLYRAFETLDKKQDEYKQTVERLANKREIFDFARVCDQEMRQIIDEVLAAPVCEQLFGTMSVYAVADGLPVWANLMLAIMDEVDAIFAREQKRTNPRISKYTAKYHK